MSPVFTADVGDCPGVVSNRIPLTEVSLNDFLARTG